jgi:hypothetical protein
LCRSGTGWGLSLAPLQSPLWWEALAYYFSPRSNRLIASGTACGHCPVPGRHCSVPGGHCLVPGRHCLVPGRHFSVSGAWQLVTFWVASECHHHAKLLPEQPCSTSPALLCHCPLLPTHPALLPLPLDSTPNSLYIPTPVPARYLTLMVSMMLGRPQKMRMI